MAKITKEQAADKLATHIVQGFNVFRGMSSAQISAILQFGADATEIQAMLSYLNGVLDAKKESDKGVH